jgi:phosphatidylglycerol lysyltransferase
MEAHMDESTAAGLPGGATSDLGAQRPARTRAAHRLAPATERAAALWRRLPFTSSVVVALLLVGLATGTFWSAAEDRSWYPQVAYGLPSFLDGRWWTLLTGPFLAVTPLSAVAMIGSFALLVGIGEWLLGTRLAAAVTVVGQLVGVLVAAGFLLSVRGAGWRWAVDLSQRLDVGFEAGAMAVIAVASAVLRPPWRLRIRLLLGLYVIVSVIYLGSLADVEHFVVVALGLAAGPRLTCHLGVREPGRPSRRGSALLGAESGVACGPLRPPLPRTPHQALSPRTGSCGCRAMSPRLARHEASAEG